MQRDLAGQVSQVGALAEPTRWDLYRVVAAAPEPMSREQTARAVGLPLHSVKFHLDRLVTEGLLEVEYRRLTGRTGPGAGRPAKLYRRAEQQVMITLPERRYELAGELLATAIERSVDTERPVAEAVHEVARDAGLRIGRDARSRPPTGDDDTAHTVDVLAAHGYEPRRADSGICLGNCPFDRLATAHTELVCGMNLALLGGLLEGLEVRSLRARLDPAAGLCCVRLAPTSAAGEAATPSGPAGTRAAGPDVTVRPGRTGPGS